MSYQAISATTATLIAVLEESFSADAELAAYFAGGANRMVSPRTPQEMTEAEQGGVSLWLYRIERDPELLNQPPQRVDLSHRLRRPLPLKLHYLVTPVVPAADDVSNAPGTEQLLIGKVLQTFHDQPELAGSQLRRALEGTGTSVRVRLEPLDLPELTSVWDALDSSYQLCISYEVSVTLIASETEGTRVAPVDVVLPEDGLITAVSGP